MFHVNKNAELRSNYKKLLELEAVYIYFKIQQMEEIFKFSEK